MAGAVVLGIISAAVAGWFTVRVPYHVWRWKVANKGARQALEVRASRIEDVRTLLGGEPRTWQDYQKAVAYHEEALVRLKYLARREFSLRQPITTAEISERFYKAAIARFPNRLEWSWELSPAGDSVTITTTPNNFAAWEKFIGEFGSPKTENQKPECRRKCHRSAKAAVDEHRIQRASRLHAG